MNPLTVAQLAQVSPLEADPAGFAAQADLPEGLHIRDGGAVLQITATNGATGEDLQGAFTLRQQGQIHVLSDMDATALRALQATIRAWKTANPDDVHGSLTITIEGCTSGRLPAPEDTINVALRVAPDAPLRPVLRNLPVSELLAETPGNTFPPCNTPAPG
ncbi:hypothetical protein [Actibacterium mucosum]|uniref:hypothetical protein n=1 Tax=Actibacterium mucosum TaxID=1087332 RepID=UPI0012693004|nr:hypothetical protein [Actibacterium mucosum]